MAGTTGLEPAFSALTVPSGLQLLHAPIPSAEVETDCSVVLQSGMPGLKGCVTWWHRHSCLCACPMHCLHSAQPRVAVPLCKPGSSPAVQTPTNEEGKHGTGTGIEPACVAYETTEEPLLNPASTWSGRRDFNPRSPVPETGALSTRPLPVILVGMRGFEPPSPSSKACSAGVPTRAHPGVFTIAHQARVGTPALQTLAAS